MIQDPAFDGTSIPIAWPPESGPGSDKAAWVTFAREMARGNEEAWEVVDGHSARIASLEAEVAHLRARLADCAPSEDQPDTPRPSKPKSADRELADDKPRDARRKMSEDARAAIRADLAAGLSQSQAARRNGVSAMTVSRLVRGA